MLQYMKFAFVMLLAHSIIRWALKLSFFKVYYEMSELEHLYI